MLVWSWCKLGATLYMAISTVFTIRDGVLKTPRDKYIDKEGYLGKNEIKNGIIVRSKSHIYNQTRRFYYEMH